MIEALTRPRTFRFVAAAVTVLTVAAIGLATWAILKSIITESKVVQITQRIVRIEQPSAKERERRLKQAIRDLTPAERRELLGALLQAATPAQRRLLLQPRRGSSAPRHTAPAVVPLIPPRSGRRPPGRPHKHPQPPSSTSTSTGPAPPPPKPPPKPPGPLPQICLPLLPCL